MTRLALMAAIAACSLGTAAAQSNSLTLAAPDVGKYTEAEIVAVVRTAGFAVGQTQPLEDGTGVVVISAAPNGIPYLFKLTHCDDAGCAFVEMLAPVMEEITPTGISAADLNDFNRLNPMLMLTAEQDGLLALRFKLPAFRSCPQMCRESAMASFVNMVNITYISLNDVRNQRVVAEADVSALSRSVSYVMNAAARGHIDLSGHRVGAVEDGLDIAISYTDRLNRVVGEGHNTAPAAALWVD